MPNPTYKPLTRDGVFIRLAVLLSIGIMIIQTIFMSQLSFFGEMSRSMFQRWIGLPCPLCGGTRAMHALFVGDIHRALYLNWLSLPVLFIGILLVLVCCIEFISRRSLFSYIKFNRRLLILLVAAFVALWGLQIFQALYVPKPELLNRSGVFFKFYKFPEAR